METKIKFAAFQQLKEKKEGKKNELKRRKNHDFAINCQNMTTFPQLLLLLSQEVVTKFIVTYKSNILGSNVSKQIKATLLFFYTVLMIFNALQLHSSNCSFVQ